MERMDRIIDRIAAQTEGFGAIKTGVGVFDAHTDFLRRGTVSLLGGRPGMGKTAIAVQITQEVARRGGKVVWFSADLSARQLAERIAAHDFPAKCAQNVCIEDRIAEIGALCRAMTAGAAESDLIVIDPLQSLYLLSSRDNDGENAGRICMDLQNAARGLGAAVLLLSTVRRRVDARKNHLPRPDDVPEWERVGRFVDNVCLFYREEYYDDSFACELCGCAYFRVAPSVDRCCSFCAGWDLLRNRILPKADPRG